MDPRNVIIRPLVTEKGVYYAETLRIYPFEVDLAANKTQIKNAIETIYDVKVKGVRTMNMSGKKRRVRYRIGRKPRWKKALVTLAEGGSIEII